MCIDWLFFINLSFYVILRQIMSLWYRLWNTYYWLWRHIKMTSDIIFNIERDWRLDSISTGDSRQTSCRNTQCWLVPRTPFNPLKQRLVIYRWNGNFMLNPTVCYLEFKTDLKRREERLNAANAELMCWRFSPDIKHFEVFENGCYHLQRNWRLFSKRWK